MRKPTKKAQAEKRGRRAENWAALYLQLKGYRVLARRYKTKSGEIDLIARRGNVLAMVEVKQRATLAAAHESLHPASLRRIENAAAQFLNIRRSYENCDIRFDVIFVLPKLRIKHIMDAWRAY
jgi:putative endonuclease